jgi:chorismate synthase
VAQAFLRQALGAEVISHVVELGSVRATNKTLPTPQDREPIDKDPLRCFDPQASTQMVAEVEAAKADADTLGGIIEVLAYFLPPGLGSHVQWDRKLDGRIAAALLSIQSVKGVEIGDAFTQARSRGSVAHDEIVNTSHGLRRTTDRAGGLEGGITTGEILRVRAALKPISSLNRPLQTVDMSTGEAAIAITQRSDVCAVPAGAVVAEAMLALVLTDAVLEKFGGDSLKEIRRNVENYRMESR